MFFNLFSQNKEYISCEDLEYGIHFDINGLFHFATFFHSDKNYKPVVKLTGNLKSDFKNFLKEKNFDKKMHRNCKIISRCENCFQLKKDKWKKSKLIKKISIASNRKCNSDCIYCTTHKNKQYFNNMNDVPVYDFIKNLFDKKLISSDCEVQIGGGESVLHKEFDKLMNLFLDLLTSRITVFTSGIEYSESIEKAIKLNRANIVISIDSGNRELYKKIKTVDKFDNVAENLARYCKAQKNNCENKQVAMKYILIPSINSTKEFIDEFFELVNKINCKAVRFDIENNWYKNNMHNINSIKYIMQFMKYFDEKAEKMYIQNYFFQAPEHLIKKYKELYETI